MWKILDRHSYTAARVGPFVLMISFLALTVTCKKQKPESGAKEISSGIRGAGESFKECEEVLYEVSRYKPKYDEALRKFSDSGCDLSAHANGVDAPVVNVKQDTGKEGLYLTNDPLDGLGAEQDPDLVKLVYDGPEKTKLCQDLKVYLDDKDKQLQALTEVVNDKTVCSKEAIRRYQKGEREVRIVDHPTCGYYSRCMDSVVETDGVKCSRCWLDTYKVKSDIATYSRGQQADVRSWSSITCNSELAARDAVELFCNNIKPGSCKGANDSKIKCEAASLRSRESHEQHVSGQFSMAWEGTTRSFSRKVSFTTAAGVVAGAEHDIEVFKIPIGKVSIDAGVGAKFSKDWNLSLTVKDQVGTFLLQGPPWVMRDGFKEGAPGLKFRCGIEVVESQMDATSDGTYQYLDITVKPAFVGLKNRTDTGTTNVDSKGQNKWQLFASKFLTGAGMTMNSMAKACERYNRVNMKVIMEDFLSSKLVRFTKWRPQANECRKDRDCKKSGGGWTHKCELPTGKTIGQCRRYAGHGMTCPTQAGGSRYPCYPGLGCKLKRYASFLGVKFNKEYRCQRCDQGRDAENYCKEN